MFFVFYIELSFEKYGNFNNLRIWTLLFKHTSGLKWGISAIHTIHKSYNRHIPSGQSNSKSPLNVFLAQNSFLFPSVFSRTVVCLTKATSPPPSTRHLNAPINKTTIQASFSHVNQAQKCNTHQYVRNNLHLRLVCNTCNYSHDTSHTYYHKVHRHYIPSSMLREYNSS